ncbi:MAG: decarboxylating NADP(+)-dependent phosphogluconate dehydrogenase [Oscillospiraceae bacterium]|nr:decarboxylating NADP(+)-dependent phosphogluconate dehydrogenase [Oscillospiraceae bacterium]
MYKSDIGLIGLAVMGENLVMNMESKGFSVCVFNRTAQKVTDFLNGRAAGKNITGAFSLIEFVLSLKTPRKIMLLVKAGQPVDDYIEELIPLLSPGDIIIDGGNSHFTDSIRRTKYVESKDLLFIGTGVSGGEEGALTGPSIMPGGSFAAWSQVSPLFKAIAAKVGDNVVCCDWVGSDGAGHFVKMVHNGIEYGDMQLICEAYHIMKTYLGMSIDDMHKVFKVWNEGELDSYLIEITRDILAYKDDEGNSTVESILDTAGQKGTGKWTSVASFDEGVPLTLIGEAVYARYLSALKDERVRASDILAGPSPSGVFTGDKDAFVEDIRQALFASKIVSYAQGFALMRACSETYNWNLNFGEIAMLWRGGCIIRSAFLSKIKDAFDRDSKLDNLLLDPFFRDATAAAQSGWRRVCAAAIANGVAIPALASALTYYDGYRTARLPANLLQAQRDYFGAHTYERTDKPRSELFHTNWTGLGGNTAATSYNV